MKTQQSKCLKVGLSEDPQCNYNSEVGCGEVEPKSQYSKSNFTADGQKSLSA